MLADPILLPGALLEAFEDALFVHVKQASFQVDAHAVAQQALHALAAIRGRREPVGHFVRDSGGLERLGGQRRQDAHDGRQQRLHNPHSPPGPSVKWILFRFASRVKRGGWPARPARIADENIGAADRVLEPLDNAMAKLAKNPGCAATTSSAKPD